MGVVELSAVAAAHELVEHRQRIAHRPPARAHDEGQHAPADLDSLIVADARHVIFKGLRRDEPERIVVGARADRPDDLFGLRRGKYELDVRRRLLHEFEKRVEPLIRDHVGLVDDEDLVPVARGGESGAFDELTGVVDAAVARRVHFDDVEASPSSQRELAARLADPTGRVRRSFDAVEAPGQDAGRRRLAASAGPREKVRVGRSIGAQRGHDRPRHVFLADDLLKGLRTVASVQCHAHGISLRAPSDISWSVLPELTPGRPASAHAPPGAPKAPLRKALANKVWRPAHAYGRRRPHAARL